VAADGEVTQKSQGKVRVSTQLSLFDPPPAIENISHHLRSDDIAKISWSYSRRGLLEQCTRRYYYQYFGASKRVAKDEKNKESLQILKGLQNRYERTGQILHLAIGTYLRNAQKNSPWNPDRLISWAKDIFNKDISYSQSDPDGSHPHEGRYPPTLLSEFYNRDPEAIPKCQQAEEKLIEALNSFTKEPLYLSFRTNGIASTAIIEKPFKLSGFLPCRIDGRIDLAYFSDETITIVDWKMGTENGSGDESLQLAAYALWANKSYDYSPESMRICKVHLGSRTIVDFKCNEAVLTTARVRIIQDAERMNFLQKYGEAAIIDAFTPCAQPGVCKLCPFLKICPEGRESLND